MQRNLSDLKAEAKNLGLSVTQSGKRESKDDYIQALRSHFLSTVKMTPGLAYRLTLAELGVCLNVANLGPEFLNRALESEEYAAEEKENGARLLVIYTPEGGYEFFGRNVSVEDYLPVSYTDHIWLGETPARLDFPFALDAEVVCESDEVCTADERNRKGVTTKTQLTATCSLLALNTKDSIRIQQTQAGLQIRVFDCLMLKGVDLKNKPYRVRREAAKRLADKLSGMGLPFYSVKSVVQGKKAFLKEIWDRGGEGIILKPLNGLYLPTSSRPRTGWLKVKRTVSGSIGDTVDGWISGFEPGDPKAGFKDMVGALHVSCYLTDSEGNQRIHLIARVANIELKLRKAISHKDSSGELVLDPSYLGRVVECEGQDISGRAKRLTHPRLIRFREDKSPDQCVMEESTLDRLIM